MVRKANKLLNNKVKGILSTPNPSPDKTINDVTGILTRAFKMMTLAGAY